MPFSQTILRAVCVHPQTRNADLDQRSFANGFASTRQFIRRFAPVEIDFRDKAVLDVGCGYGATCVIAAEAGAASVLGIDIDERSVVFARAKLEAEYPELAERVTYVRQGYEEVRHGKFDLILSKDSFEHIANPERFVDVLLQHLNPAGLFVVGFSPLWKSPYGGHITYMTKLPWAHLLFDEATIMEERKRFRPDEPAPSFAQIRGGLNKMTIGRFRRIMNRQGLRCVCHQNNVFSRGARGRALGACLNALTHVPFCEEYFTVNSYSVWQRVN